MTIRQFKYEAGKPVIPKFVTEIMKRVYWTGLYTYELRGTNANRRAYGIDEDTEKLAKWAESYGAEFLVKHVNRKPKNYYVVFEMSDPVAHALEKVGLLK